MKLKIHLKMFLFFYLLVANCCDLISYNRLGNNVHQHMAERRPERVGTRPLYWMQIARHLKERGQFTADVDNAFKRAIFKRQRGARRLRN